MTRTTVVALSAAILSLAASQAAAAPIARGPVYSTHSLQCSIVTQRQRFSAAPTGISVLKVTNTSGLTIPKRTSISVIVKHPDGSVVRLTREWLTTGMRDMQANESRMKLLSARQATCTATLSLSKYPYTPAR